MTDIEFTTNPERDHPKTGASEKNIRRFDATDRINFFRLAQIWTAKQQKAPQDITQNKMAKFAGFTQAAVSQYLSLNRYEQYRRWILEHHPELKGREEEITETHIETYFQHQRQTHPLDAEEKFNPRLALNTYVVLKFAHFLKVPPGAIDIRLAKLMPAGHYRKYKLKVKGTMLQSLERPPEALYQAPLNELTAIAENEEVYLIYVDTDAYAPRFQYGDYVSFNPLKPPRYNQIAICWLDDQRFTVGILRARDDSGTVVLKDISGQKPDAVYADVKEVHPVEAIILSPETAHA